MKYRYFQIGKKMQIIESEEPLSLERLQELVGGYIEFAQLHNGNTICVNEEGLILKLPVNPNFTQDDTPNDISLGLRGDVVEGSMDENDEFVGCDN